MKKVIVRFNQLSHLPELYQNQIKNLSDFYQQLPYDHDFTEVYSTDLDQTFIDLKSESPDWVVVLSLGHHTQNRNLYNELIQYATEQGEFKRFVAHLMNFPDQFPHIHPQLFLIHYPTWLSIGEPTWAPGVLERGCFIGALYQVSNESYHDNYTPHWIRPEIQATHHVYQHIQTGARVINRMLMHGHTVYNIPTAIRSQKFHIYPDQDWQEFSKFLSGSDYTGNNSAQKYYTDLIGHLSNQVQKQYYVLNTEALTDAEVSEPIDHYAGVASGLKLFCTMVKNGFDSHTAVTVFDFSNIALEFQKYLKANWDGDLSQYQMICKVFENSTPGHYPCLPSGAWTDYYDHMLSQLHMTPLEFQVQWNRYRKLDVVFKKINLYDSADQIRLAERCAQYINNYLWVSNAFYMEYSLVKLGLDRLKEIRSNFFHALDDSNAQIILDTNDHWHQGLIKFNSGDQ